jgi:hypothetical protein
MTHEHSREKKPFEPADYPALREFFPAYLHQDFAEEYSSVADAAKGFISEASGDEILQVKEEWKAFRQTMRTHSWPEIQAAIEKLGSAWLPKDETQLKELDEILSHAET